jgi:hypothetical protein
MSRAGLEHALARVLEGKRNAILPTRWQSSQRIGIRGLPRGLQQDSHPEADTDARPSVESIVEIAIGWYV